MYRSISATTVTLVCVLGALAQAPCKHGVSTFFLDGTSQVFYSFDTCEDARTLRTVIIWRGVERDGPQTDPSQLPDPSRNAAALRAIRATYPGFKPSGMLSSKGSWWIGVDSAGVAATMFVTPNAQLEFAHEYSIPAGDSILVFQIQHKTADHPSTVEGPEVILGPFALPASETPTLSRVDREPVTVLIRKTKFGVNRLPSRNETTDAGSFDPRHNLRM